MTIAHERFELASADGDPIRGDVWSGGAEDGDAAIVICHGFKGFKDWGFFPYTARQLASRTGRPVVTFNFSGNGVGSDLENFTELDKFERNTFSKELDDLKVVLDALEAGQLPAVGSRREFGLLGHSRGGISSLITAAEDPRVACLVTWNAVAYVARWTDEQKQEYLPKIASGEQIWTLAFTEPTARFEAEGVELEVDTSRQRLEDNMPVIPVIVRGIDKEAVGQAAAEIRQKRKVEPFRGKGIRYRDEHVRRKSGKAGKIGGMP